MEFLRIEIQIQWLENFLFVNDKKCRVIQSVKAWNLQQAKDNIIWLLKF